MSEREMETLLPCPFCGGSALIIPCPPERDGQETLHRPQCDKCGADCGGCDTPSEAIALWNRRTPDATHLREVNAALVEALREIEAKARELADDAMTNQRGLWLACANEARAALARATGEQA